MHIVVAEEYHMGARLGPPYEMGPFLNQGLPRPVRRMSLTGKDELHRPLSIGQQAKQSLRVVQQQVWPLVGRERRAKPSVKALGSNRCLAPSTASGDAPEAASCRTIVRGVFNERFGSYGMKFQSLASERGECPALRFQPSQPSAFSAGFSPQIVRFC